MRTYALTYPQLMNQAAGLGLAEPDLVRLRDGHELAMRLLDGLYRRHGAPFLCHAVRTSSIALMETRSTPVTLAAMLHAAYFLHMFQGSGRRGPRPADREFLRRSIGEHAERLIDLYGRLAWNDPGVIRGYAKAIDRQSTDEREVLLMRLSNELEDHLDAVTAYHAGAADRSSEADMAAACVELARAMDCTALASDLREAFDACTAAKVPSSIVCQNAGSYELGSRLWKASFIERAGSVVRRLRASR